MRPNALPVELRDRPQWVCWSTRNRHGKETKVPLDPTGGNFASTADDDTWGSFDEALGFARRSDVAGIGFVFTSKDPIVGIDLDDCRDPVADTLTDEAVTIVTRLHSYTEVSPSGTGLHIIAKGRLPDGQRRRDSVEMYEDGRFFTMTGEQLPATPDRVCDRPGPIRVVHEEYVAPPPSEQTERARSTSPSTTTVASSLDDEEVLEKARRAENGEKFSALWRGDTSGYDSHSEADMALCCLLAFWTGGDQSQVDALFRRSRLLRPKWDEVHYADGATYGEKTVERACARVSEHYSPTSPSS